MGIAAIFKGIENDIAKVEPLLFDLRLDDPPLMRELMQHVFLNGGKRVRPALTLLSARYYDYDPEALLHISAAVEMLHTATLIHDDTVDNCSIRRGKPTINSLWGQEVAILFGDYLFSSAACMAARTKNVRVMSLFAETLKAILRGELSQLTRAWDLNTTLEVYTRDIGAKTAVLFSTSTELGALVSRAPEAAIQALRNYGYNLGVCFQITDDILDFTGTEEELGKPVGSDLSQGTFTLPVILILQRYPEGKELRRLLEARNDRQNILMAVEIVRGSAAIEESYRIASDFCSKACRDLEGLPDGPSKKAMADLAGYVVERRK